MLLGDIFRPELPRFGNEEEEEEDGGLSSRVPLPRLNPGGDRRRAVMEGMPSPLTKTSV